jgi:stearoyl-CoA desaturase (delta-9 desaturase)
MLDTPTRTASAVAPVRPEHDPNVAPMSRWNKGVNIVGIVAPVVALGWAIWTAWGSWVSALDLTLLVVGHVLTALGVTVGFHRLLTHRAFKTVRPIRYTLAILGCMSVQGPALDWVADHRKHHQFSDHDGDPHSPVAGFGGGFTGAVRGFFHSHVGWLFTNDNRASQQSYVPDLLSDRPLASSAGRSPGSCTGCSPACSGAAACASSSSTT